MADLGALDNLKKINGQAPQEAAAGVAVTTGTAAIAIDSAQIRDHVKAINANIKSPSGSILRP